MAGNNFPKVSETELRIGIAYVHERYEHPVDPDFLRLLANWTRRLMESDGLELAAARYQVLEKAFTTPSKTKLEQEQYELKRKAYSAGIGKIFNFRKQNLRRAEKKQKAEEKAKLKHPVNKDGQFGLTLRQP